MDASERQDVEERLQLMEWLVAAMERRHEVMDLLWEATDREEAAERLRDLLNVDGGDPRVVLDLQLWRLTKEGRDKLAETVREMRELLRQHGPSTNE
jgi:DNA gyrase/topoisomerase IV subunit A